MAKHRVVIDSAFGSYAIGRRPTAVGNAFLYDEPTLLLWVDEILCDQHAFAGEKAFAAEGWLASQLFARLAKEGIVKAQSFAKFFSPRVVARLRVVSERDFRAAARAGMNPTSTVDPDRLRDFQFNGLYDINALLLLCQSLGVPFVDVSQTQRYYEWAIRRLTPTSNRGSRKVFRHALSLFVPTMTICPKTPALAEASAASGDVFRASELWAQGKIDEASYRKRYNQCLDKWHRYDDSVRAESVDRLEAILQLRSDQRLQSLRRLAARLADRIAIADDASAFDEEAIRAIKLETLEVQRELVNRSKWVRALDRTASYISPPLEVGGAIGGVIGVAATNNPLFAVAGMLPRGLTWAARRIREGRGRKRAWYFFALDARASLDRRSAMRALEAELRKVESQ